MSSTQIVVLVGAITAALAGLGAGAAARPAAAIAGRTLGPRMDFDLAAHPAAPPAPVRLALQPVPPRAG